MQISNPSPGSATAIVALFETTFTASEGADEGALIGKLAQTLLTETPAGDLHVFSAEEHGAPVGACMFTRLRYEQDERAVWVLAPVAVATERQGQGIGQQLLTRSLNALRERGVDVVMTYGDPRYYSRVGFLPVTEAEAAAPFPLQYPHGWQRLSLTSQPWLPLRGPSQCVAALNDPVYW